MFAGGRKNFSYATAPNVLDALVTREQVRFK